MTHLNRRAVLVFGAMLAISPRAALAAGRPPVVLFVCPAGTAKSAIARELFRKRAQERGIAATAFSRGLHIDDHISAALRQNLDAEGIDTRRDGFAVLAPKDARRADVVVTFAPLPAAYRSAKLRDWSAVPSVNDAWPTARADLDRRIDALLDTLAVAKGSKRR
jgi:Low molecular weight phosphotyrosine protein phosphatase